ncbi:MAG: hypothetical protein ACREEM_16855 [Blastocatellia bacterium]
MTEYSRLCVVTAVDLEFNIAAGLLTEKSFSAGSLVCLGRCGNRLITVLKAGMGATGFAARFESQLTINAHDALIVAGLAGGLDSKLRVGDAVVYDRCLDAGKDAKKIEPTRDEIASIVSDDPLSEFVIGALRASGVATSRAAGITVDRIVTQAKEKLALGVRFGVSAVDMETFEIWDAARQAGVPVAALRIISDDAAGDIPDFNRAYAADGRMIATQMAAVMAARPGVTARFLNNLRVAAGAFKKSLNALFDA